MSSRHIPSSRWKPAGGFFLRLLLATAVVIAAALLVLLAAGRPADNPPGTPPISMTFDPAVIENLTRLPQATPLSGPAAAVWLELQAQVDTCPDYTPERRAQMHQHIQWALDPASLPANLIPALGTNPTGRLAFGLASYTSIEWRLAGRPAASCLVAIGLRLNGLLESLGETPFDLYPASP